MKLMTEATKRMSDIRKHINRIDEDIKTWSYFQLLCTEEMLTPMHPFMLSPFGKKFVTLCKETGVSPFAVDRILGINIHTESIHAIYDTPV